MPSESKKTISPLLLCLHCSVSASSAFSVSPMVHFKQNTSSSICFEWYRFFFFFFLKRSTILIRLWTQIFVFQYPLKNAHCELLGTQQWHLSVLSTHWPTLPAKLPTVQGLEHDSVHSGLHLNASSATYQPCDLGTYYLTFLCLSFFTYKIVPTL